MTNNFALAQCLISLGMLSIIWFGLFRSLRRDNFRSDIRRIRDELFDFMWKNGQDFNAPAYRETRQMLNGMLRISNVLTPATFVIGALFASRCPPSPESKKRFQELPDGPLKQQLEKAQSLALRRLLTFVFCEGALGLLVRLALRALVLARLAFRAKEWASRKSRSLLSWAYVVGNPELSPTQIWMLSRGRRPILSRESSIFTLSKN
jgi:hypothetical protein